MLVSYKAIGRNIRAARAKTGMTQEQTAERLKISQLHYGRLERGERPASLEQLAEIAGVLGVSVASLLSGCIAGESFGAEVENGTRTLSESIAEIANGCSDQAQTWMLALCQTVANEDKKSSNK